MRKGFFGKTALVAALISLGFNVSLAQNFQEIRLKGTFPFGNFDRIGETSEMLQNNEIGSGAANGISAGYRYSFELGSGILLHVGGDIMWNNTCSRYREICRNFNGQTAPTYFNFPMWVGVSLRTPLFNSTRFVGYLGACAGLNVHYTTSTGWKNFEVRYKPSFSPALSLEAGVNYRKISLGVELLTLGTPTIRGTGEETHHKFRTLEKKRSMLMANVVLSYKLSKQKREWRPARKMDFDM